MIGRTQEENLCKTYKREREREREREKLQLVPFTAVPLVLITEGDRIRIINIDLSEMRIVEKLYIRVIM